MQRLTRVPRLGPAVAWFFRSRVWQVYQHLDARQWTRLAAAITFTSFVTLFPALALAAAVVAALLDEERLDDVERWFADQVPGISDQLDLAAFFDHAGTIGFVSALLVLSTGANWVEALRGCLRTLWDLPEPEENFVQRRIRDVGVLAGLGGVTALSLAASGLGMNVLHQVGSGIVLQIAAYLLAIVVTCLLLAYMLVWMPGVRPPRHAVITACLMGAVGFELLKLLLGSYLTDVAGRNVYGAFGVPIALLIWINLMAKLLLACCAWTATAVSPEERPCADALEAEEGDDDGTHTHRPPAVPQSRP
ncbi:YihY/virulence factor BrkB family protein [Streptomyces sp. URMC 129]|uniref:YihY/virulence factor BrkB family protein n=1 Tax=Streptomyces sp. URMC 129 TaxID=3423407 RepID=UPI003F1BDE6A